MTVTSLLASIAIFVPLPAHVNVVPTRCPIQRAWIVACTDLVTATIYMPHPTKLTLAHELGHVWDSQNLDDADRANYSRMVSQPDAAWFSADPDTNLDPLAPVDPGERFADSYALCSVSPKERRRLWRQWLDYVGSYGEIIPRRALANTCWLLHRPR